VTSEVAKQLFLQFGTSTMALALVAWLAREIAKHWLSKDIDLFKERVRSELRRDEFVFQQVRERRALVIAELFKRLQKALTTTREFVMMSDHYGSNEQRSDAVHSTAAIVKDARDYFSEHCIWLERDLTEKIENLFAAHGEQLFYKFAHVATTLRADQGKGWAGDEMTRLLDQANEQVPTALRELQDLFRTTLGADADVSRRNA